MKQVLVGIVLVCLSGAVSANEEPTDNTEQLIEQLNELIAKVDKNIETLCELAKEDNLDICK